MCHNFKNSNTGIYFLSFTSSPGLLLWAVGREVPLAILMSIIPATSLGNIEKNTTKRIS